MKVAASCKREQRNSKSLTAKTDPAKSRTATKSSSAAIAAFGGAVLEGETLDKAALMSGDHAVCSIKRLKSENADTWKREQRNGKCPTGECPAVKSIRGPCGVLNQMVEE